MDPAVTRQFMINFRYKKFPPLPPMVAEAVNANLKIDYLGTLAKSQKMEAAASIDRWMGTTVALSEAYPQVRDIPNVDEVARYQAENEGVPTFLLNSRVEVKRNRLANARKAAQAEAIAMTQAQGDAAQSVGAGAKAIKEGTEGAA